MAFTCYSSDSNVLGCGSLHRTLPKAQACCRIHAKQYGEERDPVRVEDKDEMETAFGPSDAAKARRAEWRATNTDNRKSYDVTKTLGEGDLPKPDGESGDQPAAGAAASGDDSSLTQVAGEVTLPPVDAPAQESDDAQSEADAPSGGAPNPLQPLADGLDPLMSPKIVERAVASLSEVVADAVAKLDPKSDDETKAAKAELRKLNGRLREASEKLEEKAAQIDAARDLKVVTTAKPEGVALGHTHHEFERLLRLVSCGDNVFMSGPAGSGKTTAAKQVAEALGMELIIQPVATDKFDAVGFVDASGQYRESAVYRWAKSEKPALLLIDEVDGWHPAALVALNPVLDNRIGIFPGGQQFDIHPDSIVIATANTWGGGADSEYCGRNRLDAASLDRFGARLPWGYDEVFERKIIATYSATTEVAQHVEALTFAVRGAVKKAGVKVLWGPRQSIGLAKRMSAGMSGSEALEVSAIATVAEGSRKAILDAVPAASIKYRHEVPAA